LPANFTDPLEENEPLRYRVIREYCRTKYGDKEDDIRQLIARYWGLVTQVDRSVGAILRTLENLGLAENTIVVYTSDHGDMMGSHHMVEKSVMYEEAVRIPWLMRIPRLKGGSAVTKPVSQIDMIPTLLDLFGVDCDRDFPGQSLVPLIKGKAVAREDVLIQWNPNSGALKVKKGGTKLASEAALKHIENEHSRAVISPDGWKLCLSDVDKSQLFNLREDPGETQNLFDSGVYQDIILKLTKKIHKWQDQVKDAVKV
jgi:arylsulfatase A-like enzyme